jgi:hypothetical protein
MLALPISIQKIKNIVDCDISVSSFGLRNSYLSSAPPEEYINGFAYKIK